MRAIFRRPSALARLAGLAMIAVLAGCASKPVTLNTALAANSNVNPDVNGRSSPIAVRVYQLTGTSAFKSADFFSLYERDKQTLGEEYISTEEYILVPGETKKIERKLDDRARAIGVLAAFRDLEKSQWRSFAEITDGHRSSLLSREVKLPILVSVEGRKVSLKIGDAADDVSSKVQQKAGEVVEDAKKSAADRAQEEAKGQAKKLINRF
ncbi:type VI secretion system lipoprotein TssJ [Parachitinimonas caeni]|uniref:Type VI secretion system lipoprotein TssJ n=1 Tax=Parachitinimonas caeni TaxID=3031301 RepID=A0ABT7E6K8_9NEIS|nr:type VI secretion system lipoprotein TssJ [Parachitinimonas caeni]MDK2126552.1 type VI secretion system lipoprotein TssJ [Parachitinimonas caeni]